MPDNKITVSQCYCDMPREKLAELVRRHYIEGVPTTKLIEEAETPEEKERVIVVSLLHIGRKELTDMIQMENPKKLPHMLDCHDHIRSLLEREGVKLPVDSPDRSNPRNS